jgi:1-acyl-sn-glycerol-3-phosphate acyltransferase
MPGPTRGQLPGPKIGRVRRAIRYWVPRLAVAVVARAYVTIRLDGRGRLPPGPAIYCFNHLNWLDPFVLMAVLPFRPRLWFFGPKEEDMAAGGRNRVMTWTGTTIPYSELLPLSEGAAYFALRSGVPLVPLAINGTSWVRFGRRVRVRVGEPIVVSGRPTRETVAALTAQTWTALHGLVEDAPDLPEPGPVGRWLTERFNDWPEGSREAARAAAGPPALAYFDPSE